ncbi:MAG: translation elongation factor Ts [Gammaproteobacteria bacterium]|tara:strand:+ start:3273 stop:4115 length:843 start_codon:yes stop_codon:yes gene_type:complete
MTEIKAADVKTLRDKTGLGIMECKAALKETGGNLEEAVEYLKINSNLKAEKKASRTAVEGLLLTSSNLMIEVNCETDFVAKDENFKTFCQDVLNYCLDNDLKSIKEIAEDLESERQSLVQKVGENVIIRKKESIKGDNLYSYIHSNGKVGALVSLQHSNEELGKDIAMHVTASNPKFLSPDEVDSETIDKEKLILKAQVEDTDKPFQIIEKMIEGRLNKYLSEISLLKQPFVKDPSISVEKILNDHKNSIIEFSRIEVGEGIEVEQKDFASEVQAQLQNS